MPEILSLPTARQKNKKALLMGALVALFLGLGIVFLLFRGQRPESSHALVEGFHQAIVAVTDGTVDKLLVAEGQPVTHGQVLLKLDDAPLVLAAQEARAALQLAAQGDVPSDSGRPELTLTIAELSRQAAALRENEDRIRRFLEHWTAEHVRALLILRSVLSAGEADRTKAVNDEASARANMMEAKAQLEDANRQRAEWEGRLQRLRQAQNSPGQGRAQVELWQARLAQAETALAGAVVRAPDTGIITALSIKQGQRVRAGETLMLFVADSEQSGMFWVTAWFSRSQGIRLRLGQPCKVDVENGPTLDGSVTSITPDGNGYMVRINLEAGTAAKGLLPGQSATVSVSVL